MSTGQKVEDVVLCGLYLIALEKLPIERGTIATEVKAIGSGVLRTRLAADPTVKLCNHLKYSIIEISHEVL